MPFEESGESLVTKLFVLCRTETHVPTYVLCRYVGFYHWDWVRPCGVEKKRSRVARGSGKEPAQVTEGRPIRVLQYVDDRSIRGVLQG